MSTSTREYLKQAAGILQSLMDNEGALTDDEEAELETWAEGTGNKLEAWRAVYRRAEAERALWKAEAARCGKVQKRAESLMVRAKLAGVEILSARDQLGEPTSVVGVCHLHRTRSLIAPERLDLWPPEMLIAQDPKPDRKAAAEAVKAGRDVGEGFYLEDRRTVVWK
tara:strand:- start:84 stop:584 length:501 start_codon:yes stop_codon:yes gene_type:complete